MANTASPSAKNTRVAIYGALIALGMLGLGFAAVPLYRIFCQVTGYGGTTQRATEDDASLAAARAQQLAGATVSVRFDANIDQDLPWTFTADQVTETVKLGERRMAFFRAKNNSKYPITGQASYNVSPDQTAVYFNKIQCFCFTAQTLQPGQEVEMPVLFYVDPSIRNDPTAAPVEQITLSYTFHRARDSG